MGVTRMTDTKHKGDRIMATTYTTAGSVRGHCGHHHRTVAAAVRCLQADQSCCRTLRGYSDRQVIPVDDGEARGMTRDEWDEVDYLLLR